MHGLNGERNQCMVRMEREINIWVYGLNEERDEFMVQM